MRKEKWIMEFDKKFTQRFWIGGKVNKEAFDGEEVDDIKHFISTLLSSKVKDRDEQWKLALKKVGVDAIADINEILKEKE